MQQQLIKVSQLKNNTGQVEGLPKNPRLIRDEKFDKLKKSLEDDPEMMQLREVIAYDNGGELVVICGNMRLRAAKDLGIKEVPVKVLPTDTPIEKLKAYTIKDNVPFGEHDWSDLANEWDADLLSDWGVDVPNWSAGHNANELSEDDLDMTEEFDPIGTSSGQQRVVFIFDGPDEAESWLNRDPSLIVKKFNNAWQVNLSTPSI